MLHPKAYNGSSRLLRNVPCTTLHGNAPQKVTAVRTSNINQKYTYLVQGETEKNSGSTQTVSSCPFFKTIMQLWNNNYITYSVWLIQECDKDWQGGDIMEFWWISTTTGELRREEQTIKMELDGEIDCRHGTWNCHNCA